jgi:hypothetical protein
MISSKWDNKPTNCVCFLSVWLLDDTFLVEEMKWKYRMKKRKMKNK